MFGIGVCFHIGHSDQILSAKDWESSKYWCLIFVSQMRIISYIVGEAAVQSVLIRKKKEISDRDKELNKHHYCCPRLSWEHVLQGLLQLCLGPILSSSLKGPLELSSHNFDAHQRLEESFSELPIYKFTL